MGPPASTGPAEPTESTAQLVRDSVDLVIEGVHVVDLGAGRIVPDRSIGIRGDRIVQVGAPGSVPATDATTVIDGRGKYVLPGLWDMHVHVLYPGASEIAFPLLIANGVTGVRDMNGPMPLGEIERLRRKIQRGERLGPRIIAPGPLIDGPGRPPDALGDEVLPVHTPDEARAAVRRLHEEGADFIKVYNRLDTELLLALTDEADSLGLPVAGHVPHVTAAGVASDAGLRSLEHLQGLLEDASDAGDRLRAALGTATSLLLDGRTPPPDLVAEIRSGRVAVVDEYDPSRARRLFARLRDNGTWVTPTLVSNRGVLIAPGDPDFSRDPRLAYLPSEWTSSWFGDTPDDEGREIGRQKFQRYLEVVTALHEVGVGLLAGTDLGVPHVFPGFSIHDELELLVEAGLDELSALRAATIGPARFLGLEDSGSIAPGYRADLVLLDANPLAEIGATRRISSVVLAGRLLDREDLDQLLERARAGG